MATDGSVVRQTSHFHPARSEVCASHNRACLSADLIERIRDGRYSNEWVGNAVRAYLSIEPWYSPAPAGGERRTDP